MWKRSLTKYVKQIKCDNFRIQATQFNFPNSPLVIINAYFPCDPQLDGFDERGDVKVIMATNKIENLDPALIRPGRIDRKIEFPLPDIKTKRNIFGIHTGKMALSDDVDLEVFVMAKDDLSGADIKAVCTEAGLLALRERRMRVCQEDFVKAKEKTLYRKRGNIPEGLYL